MPEIDVERPLKEFVDSHSEHQTSKEQDMFVFLSESQCCLLGEVVLYSYSMVELGPI